jgi:hypothetical protein
MSSRPTTELRIKFYNTSDLAKLLVLLHTNFTPEPQYEFFGDLTVSQEKEIAHKMKARIMSVEQAIDTIDRGGESIEY